MKRKYILLVFFLILFSCGEKPEPYQEKSQNRAKNGDNRGINVITQIVGNKTFQKQLITNGVVEAQNRSQLRFKTNEQLDKIYVKNGQQVKEGKVLATLDNILLKSQLENAKIGLENAERELMAEKINFGFKDTPDRDIQAKILKTIYQNSGYMVAKNAVTTAQILYDQTLLKAPFSGIVANLTVKEGNFITSGEIFCVLLSHNKLDVVFHVLESELAALKIDQKIDIVPFANNRTIYSGKITEINPLVNEEGLVRIKARIEEPGKAIFDGMNVKVTINRQMKGVVMVPKEALVMRSNREVVFTIEDGLAEWNYVEIAGENASAYALSEGIELGDTIIVSGNLNLTQDAQVNPTFVSPKEE